MSSLMGRPKYGFNYHILIANYFQSSAKAEDHQQVRNISTDYHIPVKWQQVFVMLSTAEALRKNACISNCIS